METIRLMFRVLWSPSEVMFLLSKNPRVLVPVLLLCATSLITSAIVTMKVDPADLAIRAISQSSGTADLTDSQKAMVRAATLFSATVTPALLIGFVTIVYFVLFTVIGREGDFKAFFSITAVACTPLIFRQLASVTSAFVVPASSITPDKLGSLSPALLVSREGMSPFAFAAVSTVDLVSIWILALLTIGYGFVSRKSIPASARAGAVVGIFLVYVALRLTVAALRGV
jgi:hypothetical protein